MKHLRLALVSHRDASQFAFTTFYVKKYRNHSMIIEHFCIEQRID